MSEPFDLSMSAAQMTLARQALLGSNALSERYGLSLSDTQVRSLLQAREEILTETGRIEFGEGILPKLVYAFCDSPYIARDDYADTLAALQDLFYTFKNESEDALTDDELIQAMQTIFNNKAQGSLEYLENLPVAALYRALSKGGMQEDENDDDETDDDEY